MISGRRRSGIGWWVGRSCGCVRWRRSGQAACDAIAFLDALDLGQVDVLGFSLGSFVAQEIALTRPASVRQLVLASSAPQGAAGMHGWAPEVIDAVGRRAPNPAGVLEVFFARTETSRQAGKQAFGRMAVRTVDRDLPTHWQTRQAQYDVVCTRGIPNHALLQRASVLSTCPCSWPTATAIR